MEKIMKETTKRGILMTGAEPFVILEWVEDKNAELNDK